MYVEYVKHQMHHQRRLKNPFVCTLVMLYSVRRLREYLSLTRQGQHGQTSSGGCEGGVSEWAVVTPPAYPAVLTLS